MDRFFYDAMVGFPLVILALIVLAFYFCGRIGGPR